MGTKKMLNGCLLLPSHIPEGTAGYWHCHDKTAYICPCLTHFHSLQTEEVREDKDEWNEEKTTAGCRYQVGTDWLTTSGSLRNNSMIGSAKMKPTMAQTAKNTEPHLMQK